MIKGDNRAIVNDNKFDNATSHLPQTAALQWACEVLGLAPKGQAIGSQETRRQAMSAFFERLNSNESYVESKDAEAVDIIFGKPAQLCPSFQQHYTNQQFERLDEVVDWYAGMLGTAGSMRLVEMLGQKLSGYDSPGVPSEVYAYASRIYEIAPTVQPPADEPNLAVKKIIQALFHISTVRPSVRVQVRQQWTEKLQQEFSTMELNAAKSTIAGHYKTPSENFHRPFLSMLTFDGDKLEQHQIKPPVSSGIQPRIFSDDPSPSNNERSESKSRTGAGILLAFLFFCIFANGIGRIISVTSEATSNSKARKGRPTAITKSWRPVPKIKFDPDLPADDPRSAQTALEVMLTLEGVSKEEKERQLKEFEELSAKARAARKRLEAKQQWRKERNDELANNKFFKEAIRKSTPDIPSRKSASTSVPMDTVNKIIREQREREAARNRTMDDIVNRQREMMKQQNDAVRRSFDRIPQQRSVPRGWPQPHIPKSNPFGRNSP